MKTKYDIGQKLYLVKCGEVRKLPITRIEINNKLQEFYTLNNKKNIARCVFSEKLFTTKKDCLEYHTNKIEEEKKEEIKKLNS